MADIPPRVTPYLLYEDLPRAIEWLAKAFGMRERHRQAMPDGRITHAEMAFAEDGLILMGWPGPQYKNPKHLGQVTHNICLRVDDVDATFQSAVNAGATVLEKPADQPYGERRCGVEDPEGHRWYLSKPIPKKG